MKRRSSILRGVFALLVLLACLAPMLRAWEREPLSVFAERRAKLVAAVNAPIVLFGYTGHEEANPSYVFMQEENFYYLTGHNEEGAALLLVPESAEQKGWSGPREILYLPPRDLAEERWNGPRMGPHDEGDPHAANWSKWVKDAVPQASVKDVSSAVGTLRAIKSPGELALMQKAIDPSIDANM